MIGAAGSPSAAVENLLRIARPERAEELARSLLAADPDQPAVLALLARAQLDQGQTTEALATALHVVALAPQDAESHRLLAVVATTGHRDDLALPAIERAVGLAPRSPAAHQTRAQVLLRFDRPKEALPAAEEAVRLAPHHVGPAVVRAACLIGTRRWDDADREVERALRIDASDVAAQRLGAELAVLRGRRDATDRSRAVLRARPTDAGTQRLVVRSLQSRYRVVRTLVRYDVWLGGLPTGLRWAVRLGPLLLLRILGSVPSRVGVVSTALIAAFVVTTWTARPVTMLLLMMRAETRKYLDAGQRRAALTFGVFVLLTAAVSIAAATTGAPAFVVASFVAGVWTLAVGVWASSVSRHRARMGVALGAVAVVAVAVGGSVAIGAGRTGPLMVGLGLAFVTGAAALWTLGT